MPDVGGTLFEQSFPTLKDVEFKIRHVGKNPSPRPRILTRESWPGDYIRCSNTHCRDGGYRVGDILRKMVSEARTHEKVDALCLGHEEVAGSRGRGPKCQNRLECEIRLTLREDPSTRSA